MGQQIYGGSQVCKDVFIPLDMLLLKYKGNTGIWSEMLQEKVTPWEVRLS